MRALTLFADDGSYDTVMAEYEMVHKPGRVVALDESVDEFADWEKVEPYAAANKELTSCKAEERRLYSEILATPTIIAV